MFTAAKSIAFANRARSSQARLAGLLMLGCLTLLGVNPAFSQIQFLDEASQPGGTMSGTSAPQPWLRNAVNNWMSSLPDALPVHQISIPGAHEAAARFGGLAVATQTWDIQGQLDAGIRCFDIRTRRTGVSLAIHHGAFFQHLMFGDVMNTVSAFLAAHPREAVIMRIRADEHDPEPGSQDFNTIWANYLRTYGNRIARNVPAMPTLGSIRGKVLVLRNGWNDLSTGIDYGSSIFSIQDYYDVWFLAGDGIKGSSANLPGKKKAVNEYLDQAGAANNNRWVLNYLSGSTHMAPPDVARATNATAFEHIGPNAGKKVLGTLMMDFPGEQLIYRIIKSNFAGTRTCAPQTFRDVSDHSWAEFRLPQGTEGQAVSIPSGAYNHYVFPKCNRVYWQDLGFACTASGAWQRTRGSWDADALCHGSPGSSPYLATGDR